MNDADKTGRANAAQEWPRDEDTGTLGRQIASTEAREKRQLQEAVAGQDILMASPAAQAAFDERVEGLKRVVHELKSQLPQMPPRTLAVVAAEYEAAQAAAERAPRLRAELDALLGKKPRVRKAAGK